MKMIASGLLVLGLLAVQISEADAAACAAVGGGRSLFFALRSGIPLLRWIW
jgi:hypothetical protein